MPITTRLATPNDLQKYCDLLQRTYEKSYTKDDIGLTKERFSKKVFASKHTQDYLKSKLLITDNLKTWLSFEEDRLVGSISINNVGDECELSGFYVDSDYQGKGIGKALFENVLNFAGSKNIILDIYSHNLKTIEIYKKWGFIIDEKKGKFSRHWPEWPGNLTAECIYMIKYNK